MCWIIYSRPSPQWHVAYVTFSYEDNGAVTDEESLSSFGVDLDQEAVINTNQVEGSDMNPDDP